ncbi:MAG: hypothetical protein KGI54_04860 [Pseudomonadota bacterium]|nr:hypothetical protein [Pseudomonadota bacterium]
MNKLVKHGVGIILSIYAGLAIAGGGPSAAGSSLVFDPTNYIKNTLTAQTAVQEEQQLVQQYITQLQQLALQKANSIGLSQQQLNVSQTALQNQIVQYSDYNNSLKNLYGSLGGANQYMNNVQSMVSASNLSEQDWYDREQSLASQGNAQATVLFNQGQSVIGQVNDDMAVRAQLQSSLQGSPGLNKTMSTTTQYLDLVSEQNAQALQIMAAREQNDAVKQSIQDSREKAESSAYNQQIQKMNQENQQYNNAIQSNTKPYTF